MTAGTLVGAAWTLPGGGRTNAAERDTVWYEDRLPLLDDRVRARLVDLSAYLGDADWLDGSFTVGDLMMVMVLRGLDGTGLLDEYPTLRAYVDRGTARPAYQRAFADQFAVFAGARRHDGR